MSVPAARRYLPGSLILETTWQTHTGWLIVRDALVMGPWHDIERRSRTHRRTPMDWDAEHILLRTVRCVSGTVELVMSCEPSFDYHRVGAVWEYSANAYGEAIARAGKDPDAHPTLRLTTNLRIGLEGREARARTRMTEGDNVFVALSWSKHPAPQTYEEAADKMWQTSECWRQWINIGDFPDHPWRSYLQRSALTLKGLTYSPTGALLAASTTSLPETPQGERNWDYRYAWVRDSTFALWGLYTLGLDREADDFFAFIADVSGANNDERHPLQVMYGVGGERSLVEEELHHLSGYDHARPVRIGNGAYDQMQHDIWGSMLDSVYLHAKSREQIPETLWPVLKKQVEEAIKHWREPDRGIWEVRGEPQHFTSSKVMCWVALDRGSKLAERQGEKSYAQQWRAIAEEIKADILANGVDSRGVLTQRYGNDALDASLLLVVLTRFLPPDDPRVRNTVLAIADELTEDGLVLRYRVRRDRRRAVRRGGHVHHLLVLAGVGAGRDRRGGPRQAAVRAAAVLRQPAAPLRRGDRAANRPAPGQLPAGVHPPGVDQRGGARDPRRGGIRRLRDVPARQRAHVAVMRRSAQRADSFHHEVRDVEGGRVGDARTLQRPARRVEEVDLDLDQAIVPHTDGPPRWNRRRIRMSRIERDRNGAHENRRRDLHVRDLGSESEHIVGQSHRVTVAALPLLGESGEKRVGVGGRGQADHALLDAGQLRRPGSMPPRLNHNVVDFACAIDALVQHLGDTEAVGGRRTQALQGLGTTEPPRKARIDHEGLVENSRQHLVIDQHMRNRFPGELPGLETRRCLRFAIGDDGASGGQQSDTEHGNRPR